jgi:hypothetical protein
LLGFLRGGDKWPHNPDDGTDPWWLPPSPDKWTKPWG